MVLSFNQQIFSEHLYCLFSAKNLIMSYMFLDLKELVMGELNT